MITNAPDKNEVAPEFWSTRYHDRLLNYAFQRIGSVNAAEEVVQETYLSGLKFLEQYRGEGSEVAWLLGILKRKVVDYYRAKNRRSSANTELLESASVNELGCRFRVSETRVPDPSEACQVKELNEALVRALQKLPSMQSNVFRMCKLEGLPPKQVSRFLKISSGNCSVILHRARRRLAQQLVSFEE